MIKALLPIEKICLCGIMVAGILIVFQGYGLYLPHAEGGEIIKGHFGMIAGYGKVLFIAFLIYAAGFIHRRNKSENPGSFLAHTIEFARSFLAYCLCLFLMMNFKLWSILRTDLWDETYMAFDLIAMPFLHDLRLITYHLGLPENGYFTVYLYMFIGSYAVAAIFGRSAFQRVMTVSAVIFILGGLSYMIAPAYGPFLYFMQPGAGGFFYETQMYMLRFTQEFSASGGRLFRPQDFEAPLGAMPSLHCAHAVGLTLALWRTHPLAGFAMLVVALYISIFAMLTGFHYVVDIPAGILLAGVATYITEKFMARWQRSPA